MLGRRPAFDGHRVELQGSRTRGAEIDRLPVRRELRIAVAGGMGGDPDRPTSVGGTGPEIVPPFEDHRLAVRRNTRPAGHHHIARALGACVLRRWQQAGKKSQPESSGKKESGKAGIHHVQYIRSASAFHTGLISENQSIFAPVSGGRASGVPAGIWGGLSLLPGGGSGESAAPDIRGPFQT